MSDEDAADGTADGVEVAAKGERETDESAGAEQTGPTDDTPESTDDAAAEREADDGRDAGVRADDHDDGRGDAEALAAAVADHDEALAREVAALEADLADARAELRDRDEEVAELTSKLARVRADFSNYKQRAKRKQEDIRDRASEALVERITPVRNNLLRALDQEAGSDLRPGVESTLEKFDEVLADEGVDPVDPDPGDEVDPERHQVMARVDSDRPAGTIHEVYEPGYEMGDRVLSEAKVTVSADDDGD